jgi:hypothetical protein
MNEILTDKFKELADKLKENSPPARTKHRIGRFRISFLFLQSRSKEAAAIFAGLLVVRAESRYDFDAIEYIAVGDCFDEVDRGLEAPEYRPILTRNEDGSIVIEGWRRV